MSYGYNSLIGEPVAEYDDSGMTQLVDGTGTGGGPRHDYPTIGDGTNIGVAALVLGAMAVIVLLHAGGFRAMIAVGG